MSNFQQSNLQSAVHGSGYGHWKWQRISAIALLPLTVWLLMSFFDVLLFDHQAARSWLSNTINATLLMAWLLVAAYHAYLGVQVVIEDYVSDLKHRKISLSLIKVLMVITSTVGFLAVLKLGFFSA